MFCLTIRQQEEARLASFSHCPDGNTEDQKGLVSSPRLNSKTRPGIQGTHRSFQPGGLCSFLPSCLLRAAAGGSPSGKEERHAAEVGGRQREFCSHLRFSGRLAPPLGIPMCRPHEKGLHGRFTRGASGLLSRSKGHGGVGYQPCVTSPKADSLVRSDRPPRRTASFRSPACTRGSHTARQRESGSAPSAPSKSRPSRIPSLLLTLLRVFPGEADSPATFALDQRSPPQIVRFK